MDCHCPLGEVKGLIPRLPVAGLRVPARISQRGLDAANETGDGCPWLIGGGAALRLAPTPPFPGVSHNRNSYHNRLPSVMSELGASADTCPVPHGMIA